MARDIEIRTLAEGGQRAEDVGAALIGFVEEARSSLDLALYDVRLPGEVGDHVAGALRAAVDRGVAVRLLYNVEGVWRVPVPPPPATRPELLEALPCETRGVAGEPDLMHHKYVVRDGEAVWTGSMNWTLDSWTRQENVIAVVRSPELAADFARDFGELWETGDVERSGRGEPRPIAVGSATVRAWFCPGHGRQLSHRIAGAIDRARRVRIASPVITAGAVLGTLAQTASDGDADVAGVVDATQVAQVVRQWRENGNASWKLPSLQRVMEGERFHGKHSIPWRPDSVHDFMHAKVTVCDETVFVGSFNLSRSGERNAENVLEIEDAETADRLAGFIDDVRARHPDVVLEA